MKKKYMFCALLLIFTLCFSNVARGEEVHNEEEIKKVVGSLEEIVRYERVILSMCPISPYYDNWEEYSYLNIDDVIRHIDKYYIAEVKTQYIEELREQSTELFHPKSGINNASVDLVSARTSEPNIANGCVLQYSHDPSGDGEEGRVDYITFEKRISDIHQVGENRYEVVVEEMMYLHGKLLISGIQGEYYVEMRHAWSFDIYTYYLEKQDNGEWKFYQLSKREYKPYFEWYE